MTRRPGAGWPALAAWLRRLFGRARLERQLDAELRDHLERQVADHVASGMTDAEARRRATVLFGGVDHVKEQCRDALGASPGSIRRLILGRASRLIAAGLLFGVPAAILAARLLRALIYDITPNDPRSFLTAVAVLLTGALFAVWLPARRAARVDPCVALRGE